MQSNALQSTNFQGMMGMSGVLKPFVITIEFKVQCFERIVRR